MFELFCVPRTTLVPKSTLALYSYGKTTGLVVDSGFEDTHVVPIYEGFIFTPAVRSMPVGGRHITYFMKNLFNDHGYRFSTPKDIENIRKIKELCCYYNLDFGRNATTSDKDQVFELPDGMEIEIKNEAFVCPEIMFDPALFDIESNLGGLHNLIHKSIDSCHKNEQVNMYKKIVLAGGNTMFPFLPERLKNMVTKVALPDTEIVVNAFPARKYSSWIGGSILASLDNFPLTCINKREYEEQGSSIVHLKCFF